MSAHDPRIDAYIARQADFALPILDHLRGAIHSACPEAEETLKWSMPAFLYKGEILASMAAFKGHATFGFWRGSQVLGDGHQQLDAMGQFGRLKSVGDLPEADMLAGLIKKAMSLTESGVKPVRHKTVKGDFSVPEELTTALSANQAASATFEAFPPSCRREYVDWVTEAKRPETRAKRVAQAVEWMAEGKRRNWKYENC
jgi:uncharacterized protein YdeI (YjbR/CyaY-like superfamily)